VLTHPIKLGVNIDHVATLRQVRGAAYPDPLYAALIAEQSGADSITLHLREDRRHIQDHDVRRLRAALQTRMNLEMAATDAMIAIARDVRPHDCCLVPEKREEVTTEGGLDVVANLSSLTTTRKRMNDNGIQVSLFIAPDPRQIEAAAKSGSQFIELHTGSYAESFGLAESRARELERLIAGAKQANVLGLKVNAGHGLNYENLRLIYDVPHLVELNIGHSIISRAITVGLKNAVQEMLELMLPTSNIARC